MKSGNVTVDPVAMKSAPTASNTIIDVWWLLDDGGLSLLVPHILSIDQFWRKLSSSHEQDEEETKEEAETASVKKGYEDKDSELKAKQGDKKMLRQKQRFIVRLFLVADSNIGGEGLQGDDRSSTNHQASSLHSSNLEKSSLHTTSSTHSKDSEAHLRELSRISAQGLVDQRLLTRIDDTTGQFFLFLLVVPREGKKKETLEAFCQLTGYKLSESSNWNNTKLKRWLRVSELIQSYSHEQKCVFVTAPHPSSFKDSTMYLGVLDMLSRTNDQRATVLLRGNGENVLTFYWE
ncbi:hypothetical protein RFI_30769 [Reticulomyxa filosa]|uniref:SLC12A transporter C-terminal domain-containing protein n=1 Tax=Reticulomyxa filosa TaxID=46433 RepID=X6LXE4_RETFI|nr:hypothetical protein RFI_30769 [Reticulomyxa filosa]|eukprot:ETO06623.1 hypothetical protein RFI_30769 [Reticulomyxa filosa]